SHVQPDLATSATWVIISFLMLVFMTSIALGTATATLVSRSLGEGNPSLAERFGWESVKLGMYVMGALGIAVIVDPGPFLGIFTDKIEVIRVGAPSMRLIGAVSSLLSAGLILVQALFGAGATKFVMIAELAMHGLCLVPLSYLLAITFGLGLLGAWCAAALYVVLLSSIMAWKFASGTWKKIQI
ncbi:MAG: MATE family efflux transporter, partial [Deltaproteobacteria bacterium]